MKFLSVKIRISSKLSLYQDQDQINCTCQNQIFKKMAISQQVHGLLVLCYHNSDLIVGVYSAFCEWTGVSDSPFCHVMRMLIMCCHGEVM